MTTIDCMTKKRLLFVGAGHAHLFSLARLDRFLRRGIDVTVVSPSPLWYSGVGPGLLGGSYEAADASVDVRSLVESKGGRFLEGKVAFIDARERLVRTEDGTERAYDALSLNIGSEVFSTLLDGSQDHVFAVKPVSSFLELRRRILALPPGAEGRLAVAGGGPSGCEAAANARELAERHGRTLRVNLAAGAAGLLPYLPLKARQLAAAELQRMEVEVSERRITLVSGDSLVYSDGSTGRADFLLVATGVRPPKLLAESGFEVDENGAMIVDEYLRAVSSDGVFGGGDCISFRGAPLPRVGVYAIRQGPLLFANLLAYLSGSRLRPFLPQREFLSILNLGTTGLLVRKPFVVKGRFSLLLKRWIDRRFLKEFQEHAAEKPPGPPTGDPDCGAR